MSAEIVQTISLRTRRVDLGLSVKDVADSIGVGRSVLVALEAGECRIDRKTADRLADRLSIERSALDFLVDSAVMKVDEILKGSARPQIFSFAVDSLTGRWIAEIAENSALEPSVFLAKLVTAAHHETEISSAVPFIGQPQQPVVDSLPQNLRRFALKDTPASVFKVWAEGRRVKMVVCESCDIVGVTRSVEFSFRKGLALTLAGAILMKVDESLLDDCIWLKGHARGPKPTGMSVTEIVGRVSVLFRSQISIGYSSIVGVDDEMVALAARLLLAAVQIRGGRR